MSSAPSSCRVAAPAKVNLTLEVLGRRPDGYHDLRSVLVPLALADTVDLYTAGELSLETVPDGVGLGDLCPPERNLAWRAAELLRRETRTTAGARILITKRIPIGGGLGGGSADAAAVLVGLNTLWGLGLRREALMALGGRLGCDIPSLVHGGAVCMEGRGERVTPLLEPTGAPAPAGFDVVLVNPGIGVSTAEVYRSCSGVLTAGPETYNSMRSAVRRGDVCAAAASLFNGLEAGVFARYPVIGQLAARLREAGAPGVLLSGSGASVFALVRDRDQGERVRGALPPGCWSIVTRTLPDGVMAAHGPLEP